jgi:hypothetical protein
MRLRICVAMLLTFVVIGCSKRTGDTQSNREDSATTAESGPGKDTQPCFGCNARGSTVCFGGCKSGELECPGPCLKLTRGKWEKLQVAGHDPNELWQKFPDGKGWTAWTSGHVGEVIVVQNGKAVNTGKCQRCGGAAKVKCTVCGGKGERICDFCEGKKVVPLSWTPTNNPALFRQPDLIRLKDGRVLLGRVAMKSGANYTIRTRDGKMVDVKAADILPKVAASTNNTTL